ncbi:MAG: glycosyltransferase family 2 protein [Synechococcales bacterium]|nr:glycosyltransferase family 2 protein [Synechococcales bacterium]
MLLFASVLLSMSLVCSLMYRQRLQLSLGDAPQFTIEPYSQLSTYPRVSVIIPAYNEVDNIEHCIKAVLNSTDIRGDRLEVWVVDDQSQDTTWAVLQRLQDELQDPRLRVIAGRPRPHPEQWVGKNWACYQAVERATGEFLLFIDADVRLQPRSIETALTIAMAQQSGLLTLWPALKCGCLAEWVIQPLIMAHLLVVFNFKDVNHPESNSVFAAGPFMLFQRSAYESVGGHRAVADQVVEDVALGRLVKQRGLGLYYGLGSELATVQMYRSWGALWEGWTKNFYLGAQRQPRLMGYLAFLMLVIYPLPWIAALVLAYGAIALPTTLMKIIIFILAMVGMGVTILLQYQLRQIIASIARCPTRYWWLSPLGGIGIAAIAIASYIKTETGWGWTWRGRQLNIGH